ncbi:MAG TPA: YciI family protein [Actinophytocola sp.]|jgi:hypothetical protein|uniref:YciI family protein n=1 Tax=Actinophytocola sp. TaxID=1872138 RepID=UPI002DF7C743|nr:YciI family protein [Actinophytocola sp.]
MKYVVLIVQTEAGQRLTGTDREALYSEIVAWYEKASATDTMIDSGYELAGPDTAKTIQSNGVFDGPFMEAKEILGGYYVLETDTIEEAVEFSQSWPGIDRGYITLEVRPVASH